MTRVASAAVVLLAVGCSKSDSKSGTKPATAKKKDERAAAKDKKPSEPADPKRAKPDAPAATASLDAPEKVVVAYYEAAKAGDAEKMWSLFSTPARDNFAKAMKDMLSDMPDDKVEQMVGVSKKEALALAPLALMKKMAASDMAKKRRQRDLAGKPPTELKAETKDGKTLVRFKRGEDDCRAAVVKQGDGWLMADGSVACSRQSRK